MPVTIFIVEDHDKVRSALRNLLATLVVDRFKQIDHQAAWLSLDEADNDLRRILMYLVAAFQQVDEINSALFIGALQSPQLPAIETENTNASHN